MNNNLLITYLVCLILTALVITILMVSFYRWIFYQKSKPKIKDTKPNGNSIFNKFRYLDAIYYTPKDKFSGSIQEPMVVVRKIDTHKYLVFHLFGQRQGRAPWLFELDTNLKTGTSEYRHLTKTNPSFNKHWYEYYISKKKIFDIDLRKYRPDLFNGEYDIELSKRKRKQAEEKQIKEDVEKFIMQNNCG